MKLTMNAVKWICYILLPITYIIAILMLIRLSPLFQFWFTISNFVLISAMIFLLFKIIRKSIERHRHIVLAGLIVLNLIVIISHIVLGSDKLKFTCSMYHHELDIDEWWEIFGKKYEEYDIDKQTFSNFPMKDGISKIQGYIIRTLPDGIRIGDIISYEVDSYPFFIGHRVVNISNTKNGKIYKVLSDNGQQVSHVRQNRITGKYVFSPVLDLISRNQCRDQSFFVYCKESLGSADDREKTEILSCCTSNRSMECVYDYAVQSNDPAVCKYISNYWLRTICGKMIVKHR